MNDMNDMNDDMNNNEIKKEIINKCVFEHNFTNFTNFWKDKLGCSFKDIGKSSYISSFFSSLLDISKRPPGTNEFFFGSISAALYLLLKVNLKFSKLIFFKKILSLHLLFI